MVSRQCLVNACLLWSISFATRTGPAFLTFHRPSWKFRFASPLFNHQPTVSNKEDEASAATNKGKQPVFASGVVAPLLRVGPYPCLALRFPNLDRSSSLPPSDRGDDPVALTFLLDTGANANAINSSIVEQYALERLLSVKDLMKAAGVGGDVSPGDVYRLGDCQLDGMPAGQENITFMTNLAACSFPRASPVGDGILGLAFLRCFRGVEFDWFGDEENEYQPTIQFLFTQDIIEKTQENMTRVPLDPWGPTGIVMMNVTVNGREVRGIIDTGSPVTVLCEKVADELGIAKVKNKSPQPNKDVLHVQGMDGTIISLHRSADAVSIEAGDEAIGFGTGRIFVGELLGLSRVSNLLGNIGASPEIVIGRNCLSSTQRMLLKLNDSEVWFENRHRGD